MVFVETEWGKLEEVVVGTIGKWTEVHPDFSFLLYYQDNLKNEFIKNSIKLQQRVIEQRQEDLDSMADTLCDLGVKVKRPLPLEKLVPFVTPEFEDWPSPCHNPRDQFLIIGDEIIETSCQWRKRYFENDLLKPVLLEKWKEGAHWISAPRPVMKMDSFDLEHLNDWGIDLTGYSNDDEKHEIMFDGAQCLKFGKDILMNVRTKNHWLGYKWLKRHLRGRYNLHSVDLTDNHIDGMLMPLAPGKLLINSGSMRNNLHKLPSFLEKWEILKAPEVSSEKPKVNGLALASEFININVLPLSEKKTLIFDEKDGKSNVLGEFLAKYGIEAVPIRLRHCRLFDGGAHCASLCLKRAS